MIYSALTQLVFFLVIIFALIAAFFYGWAYYAVYRENQISVKERLTMHIKGRYLLRAYMAGFWTSVFVVIFSLLWKILILLILGILWGVIFIILFLLAKKWLRQSVIELDRIKRLTGDS